MFPTDRTFELCYRENSPNHTDSFLNAATGRVHGWESAGAGGAPHTRGQWCLWLCIVGGAIIRAGTWAEPGHGAATPAIVILSVMSPVTSPAHIIITTQHFSHQNWTWTISAFKGSIYIIFPWSGRGQVDILVIFLRGTHAEMQTAMIKRYRWYFLLSNAHECRDWSRVKPSLAARVDWQSHHQARLPGTTGGRGNIGWYVQTKAALLVDYNTIHAGTIFHAGGAKWLI